MDLNSLKYFYDAVRLGSIRKAAESNFVSSPAISLGIRRLEESLGFELLIHKKNRFLPNAKGLLLAKEAKNLFSDIEDIKIKLKSPTKIEGVWTIGTQQSIAQTYFPQIIKEINTRHPNLDIIVRTATTKINIEELDLGLIDSAVMVSNVGLKSYESVSLRRGEFNIYGPSKSMDNFYLTEDTKECKQLIKNYKKEFGKEINISSRISSWGTNKAFAEAGLGNTYLPDYLESKKLQIKHRNKKNLTYPYEILFTGNSVKSQSPIALALIEICKKVISK